jgi:hypothetical protein
MVTEQRLLGLLATGGLTSAAAGGGGCIHGASYTRVLLCDPCLSAARTLAAPAASTERLAPPF